MDGTASVARARNDVRLALRQTRLTVLAVCVAISSWLWPQAQIQVGYALLTADSGSQAPVAAALFTFSNSNGVLVSQAGVGAAEPILRGRIFVDQAGTQTGLALVNPSAIDALVTLVLRDASGNEIARHTQTLSAGRHLPRFVSQLFPDLPSGFSGSLTFTSDRKLAAITLRQSQNVQGEPLYATLPVVDLSLPSTQDPIVFPQIAAGGGYSTQVVLINGTGETQRGQVALFGSDGNPLSLLLNGNSTSSVPYEISPHGTYRATLERSGVVVAGYAVVTPEPGTTTPSGTAIFQFKRDGIIVTEAGVAASTSTTAARILVDNAGSFTGVGLANRENQPATVSFALLDISGESVAATTRDLPPRGHLAIFAHELFPGVPQIRNGFTGLLEITSPTPVVPVTLKLTINQRNDMILTTLPVADLNHPPTDSTLVFPQIAIGEGFSTRLILINSNTGIAASGRLSFFQSDGSAMMVPFGGQTGSQFPYYLPRVGDPPAKIASIVLLDPSTNLRASEIAVNEGNTVRARLLVLDTTGTPRDDFHLSYTSIDPKIASIDAAGNITGRKAGFSTMTISSGDVITTATINVVGVGIGPPGFTVTGVAQDLARRLYLAATQDHTILLAQELTQRPELYAGTKGIPGLKNDARLKSLFKSPAFLAFDQAKGTVYVSDGANHVIRRVYPGTLDKVDTLAGTGSPGSQDGSATTASFNRPQGVVLDNQGNLWIVDSGNHTIRRLNLATGIVETIAGKAGSAGWSDGKGENARFSAPAGIAIESDPATASFLSPTPQPVRVIVADTGNGLLRRVQESGEVETIRAPAQAEPSSSKSQNPKLTIAAGAPLTFRSPRGVAVDPQGNIYVTEPNVGRVRAVLHNGDVVPASQAGTASAPSGIAITQNGKVVLADSNRGAQEYSYGEPQITSVTPDRISVRGGKVTIRGRNFAPDTLLIVAGTIIPGAEVKDTKTIAFAAPKLPSGLTTLTVQNRGGLAQAKIFIEPVPLNQLHPGHITTIAGGSTFAGDGGDARAAVLSSASVVLDSLGNLFIADFSNNRVRRVDARTTIITTYAGNGTAGYSGDNGPANAAQLNFPKALAIDSAGNLFIADNLNNCVRRVDAQSKIITTYAGGGSSGDNGPASDANLSYPAGLALDSAGNLFIADSLHYRVRRVDARSKIITTYAGNGTMGIFGDIGDNGPATDAQLLVPTGLALDLAGNLFIADSGNERVRRVDAQTRIITTYAGGGSSGDNGLATAAYLPGPEGLAIDSAGNLFIADSENQRVRRVDAQTRIINTYAGNGTRGFSGDNGPATAAQLAEPDGLAIDSAGNLFIADAFNARVRRVDARTNIITTYAGTGNFDFSGDNGPATAAKIVNPKGLAMDSAGNLFIADFSKHRVRKVDAQTRIITTYAGTGTKGSSGDNGPATDAQLAGPVGLAIDSAGNLFIADFFNARVRRVDAQTGTITTYAGNGTLGFSGDNGPATDAQLVMPEGLAVDSAGNLFIADSMTYRVRRVDSHSKIITTYAGNGTFGFSGDNGPATDAQLSPGSLATDSDGNLFIAGDGRVRKVEVQTKFITTYAGGGFSVDNGLATGAYLAGPSGLAIDSAGNLFIAETAGRVRRVDAQTRIITTYAGTGTEGFSGDNGPAIAAQLAFPAGLALDSAGSLFIADSDNSRVRAIRSLAAVP